VRQGRHTSVNKESKCYVCSQYTFIGISIELDNSDKSLELLGELKIDFGQKPEDAKLPEGLFLAHRVVPPRSIVLVPRYHLKQISGQDIAEIPIRCGTVEEILYSLYHYYSFRRKKTSNRRCIKGLFEVEKDLYVVNIGRKDKE
jgi:hypothetical protein